MRTTAVQILHWHKGNIATTLELIALPHLGWLADCIPWRMWQKPRHYSHQEVIFTFITYAECHSDVMSNSHWTKSGTGMQHVWLWCRLSSKDWIIPLSHGNKRWRARIASRFGFAWCERGSFDGYRWISDIDGIDGYRPTLWLESLIQLLQLGSIITVKHTSCWNRW